MTMIRSSIAAGVLATFLGGATADAQTYPTRPIQVIVPFAGGSASDVLTRILVERAGRSIGQPFIIDNRPGAGGNTGTAAAAKATPDGYTILGSGSGPIAANVSLYRDLGYEPLKDFEPIAMIAVFPIIVVASSKLPVKTLAELIAYAKQRPNELNYGSVGIGPQHLAGAYFDQVAGVKLTPRALPQHRAICPRPDRGMVPLGFQWLPNAGDSTAAALRRRSRATSAWQRCPMRRPLRRPGKDYVASAGSSCWRRAERRSRSSPSSTRSSMPRSPTRRCGAPPSRRRARLSAGRGRCVHSSETSNGVTSSPRPAFRRSYHMAIEERVLIAGAGPVGLTAAANLWAMACRSRCSAGSDLSEGRALDLPHPPTRHARGSAPPSRGSPRTGAASFQYRNKSTGSAQPDFGGSPTPRPSLPVQAASKLTRIFSDR
jgi:hypothetical protein